MVMNPLVTNEQIDYVFKQLRVTGWPHACVVTLTAWVIWYCTHSLWIIGWFLVMQGSHLARIYMVDRSWHKGMHTESNNGRITVGLCLGMGYAGCLWGILPLMFMGDPQSESFIFLSIGLAGIVSATLPALAAYLPAYLSFVMPLLLALTYRYYFVGLEAAALLSLCFLSAVVGMSYVINGIITRSITMDVKNRVLLREVTRAKEAAEDANQAKSRFLAAASHDLRQPLQALGLLLESMRVRTDQDRGDNHDEGLRILVSRGLQSHDSMSELFNALLELSRFESRELDVNIVDVRLRDMVDLIVNEFDASAAVKQLSLSVVGVDPIVKTDPVLFGRILRNLLSNAIKFTEEGKITVSMIKHEQRVVLSVMDTGVGIPSEQQEKVFDEYHQVANDGRRRQEGIGLGLSVVKKMCLLLGHDITVESREGVGTTFSLQLPEGDAQHITRLSEGSVSPLSGIQVMVIDDDPLIVDAVSMLMNEWGCPCVAVESRQAGLHHIASNDYQPDIILSDYRLGQGETGIDAITAIRAVVGESVPALLMSGDTDPALVTRIREQRYYLIQKPVKPVHLRKVMHRLLSVSPTLNEA